MLDPHKPADPTKQPRDEFERATLARFIRSAAVSKPGHSPEKLHVFADGTPTWAEQPTADRKEYHYVQAVFFKPNCLMDCHGQGDTPIDRNHGSRRAPDGQHWVKTEPGDLAGAVVVSLPMEQTTKAIASNRAMLITFALVTAVLAMVSSYLIVRYVIVEPLKHPAMLPTGWPPRDEARRRTTGTGGESRRCGLPGVRTTIGARLAWSFTGQGHDQ